MRCWFILSLVIAASATGISPPSESDAALMQQMSESELSSTPTSTFPALPQTTASTNAADEVVLSNDEELLFQTDFVNQELSIPSRIMPIISKDTAQQNDAVNAADEVEMGHLKHHDPAVCIVAKEEKPDSIISQTPVQSDLPLALPAVAETIIREILSVANPPPEGPEEEPILSEEWRVKLDLPPLLPETLDSDKYEKESSTPTSSESSKEAAESESSRAVAKSTPLVEIETVTDVSHRHDSDVDDGVDVKVLQNIMARAVESAIEEAGHSLDVDKASTESSMKQIVVSETLAVDTQHLGSFPSMQPESFNDGTYSATTATISISSIASSLPSISNLGDGTGSDQIISMNGETFDTTTSSTLFESVAATKTSSLVSNVSDIPYSNGGKDVSLESDVESQSGIAKETITSPPIETKVSTVEKTAATLPKWSDPVTKAPKKRLKAKTSDVITKKPSVPKKKTKEERFNHASFDCGALILGTNSGASSATSILVKSKDQYMLNKCKNVDKRKISENSGKSNGANYVIVELCDNIKIDTLMLANFEYFSSTFKDFNVYVAEQYPPKSNAENNGWMLLGSFLASNIRDSQYFKIKDPILFTRYLKIEFISYYGSEFYCPMTQLKVFGKTEMEEFREEDEEALAASLAKEGEAIQEAILNVAKQAVKEIDSVACIGEKCSGSLPYPVGSTSWIDEVASGAGIIFPKPTSISFESPEPEQLEKSPEATLQAVPLQESSYILSADYFRLFMENHEPQSSATNLDQGKEDYGMGSVSQTTSTTSEHYTTTGQPVVGQESIFKTISKRLALLERNSTLSYKFIEEQSRAYHAAFIRVEVARADAIKKALGECNKTMTRVVRDLAKDYEAAWSLLLRDLEKQRRMSDSRLKDVERNLEKLSERMTRQIFYEFVMVILLVLLLTRIFTPNPMTNLNLESMSPLTTPRAIRKHFSPYFSRSIPMDEARREHGVPDMDSTFRQNETPTENSFKNSLQHFGTLEEEDEDGFLDYQTGEDELLSSPDASYHENGDEFRFGNDIETLHVEPVTLLQLQREFEQQQLADSLQDTSTASSFAKSAPPIHQKSSNGVRKQSPSRKSSVPDFNKKRLLKVKIREEDIRSEPTTPMLSSTTRFIHTPSSPLSALNSKKKRRRRRSLAGLRLAGETESLPPSQADAM